MRTYTTLAATVAALAVALTPSLSSAESQAPTGEAADFLQGVLCGGAPCFDANAAGTKIFGTLTVVYDKQPNSELCPISTPGRAFVRNMYVHFTMDKGGVRVPFSTDYLNGPPSHTAGFCLLTQRVEQAKVIVELARAKVIPFFFNCDPDTTDSCPPFRIKAITNFQYTTGHPSLAPYPYSGGFSADITLATP